MTHEQDLSPDYDFEMPEELDFHFPIKITREMKEWPFAGKTIKFSLERLFDEINNKKIKLAEDADDRHAQLVLWLMIQDYWAYMEDVMKVDPDLYDNILGTVREYEREVDTFVMVTTQGLSHRIAWWNWDKLQCTGLACSFFSLIVCMFRDSKRKATVEDLVFKKKRKKGEDPH